jgi:hypothetical protein
MCIILMDPYLPFGADILIGDDISNIVFLVVLLMT